MQTPADEREVLIRGSEEHKEYLRYHYGWIKERVSGIEAHLAVTGRIMLLVYIAYITVMATIAPTLPAQKPPWEAAVLFLLDVFMSLLQVLGLEGSVPGLIHLADELDSKERHKEADKVRFAATTAQVLVAATGINIVLQATHKFGSVDLGQYVPYYSSVLFVVRLVVIGMYLKEMARLEHKGPKIISATEAKKMEEEKEQKQIKIDNANILAVFSQAIEDWMKKQPNLNASFSEAVNRLNETVSRKLASIESAQQEKFAALSRYVESAQLGSTGSGMIDSGTLDLKIESALSRSLADLNRSFESKLADLSRQVNRVEAEAARSITTALRAQQSSAVASTSNATREPEKPKARITNIAEAREEKQGSLSVEEVVARIETDPALLKLSGQQLADKLNTSKPTANRAKTRYGELHPESAQPSDSRQSEAVNL